MRRTAADLEAAERRAWEHQWSARDVAAVHHPDFGTVFVPSRSKLSAMLCAAEVWGASWAEISGPLCTVMTPPPGARPVPKPEAWTRIR